MQCLGSEGCEGRLVLGDNNAVERKFHETLEEVVALKQILQDFLVGSAKPGELSQPTPLFRQNRDPATEETTRTDNIPSTSSPVRPNIRTSRGSERLLRQSIHFERDFQARVNHYMTKSLLRKEQIRAEVDEKTREELKLKPSINKRSKRIQRSVEHLHAWERSKEIKLQELRKAELQRELEDVTGAPRLRQCSHLHHSACVDELTECKVEDRLHILGLIYEYQQEERMIQASRHIAYENKTTPILAPHSGQLNRSSKISVHERLYGLSVKQPHSTHTENHSPQAVKSKETIEAAIRRLEHFGEIYCAKRQDMALQRDRQLKNSQQVLSEKSKFLVERARSRASEKGRSHYRKCECCRGAQEDVPDASLSSVSAAQAAAIYQRHIEWKTQKDKRCQDERERRHQEEEACLDFRNPRYCSAWDSLAETVEANGGPNILKGDQINRLFYEKSVRWAEERDEQLSREREIWDKIHLRECTFKPKLCRASPCVEQHVPDLDRPTNNISLEQGYFSRANLQTPMLGADESDVSTDDCVDDDECEGGVDTAPAIAFFNNGEKILSKSGYRDTLDY